MLLELVVNDLGVIRELALVLGPGMTAITGETGAGKTLVVEAVELLVGGRADPVLVRPGAAEARVDGRFELDGEEVVLSRVIPREGRSRAYVDGRPVPAATLAEWGSRLADLHGQHAHQSLLGVATQRAAVDRFGGVDREPLLAARAELATVDGLLAALGGDSRERAREIDLLRFQIGELGDARLDDPDEEDRLEADEDVLADAVAHRAAAAEAASAIGADGAAADALGTAIGAIAARAPFAAAEARLRALAIDLGDVASEIRAIEETIEEDPARLASIRARRQQLRDLRRKYGDTLGDVMAYRDEAEARLAELESHDERASALDRRRDDARSLVAAAEAAVGAARRVAAPSLAAATQAHLGALALPKASIAVDVGPGSGDDVAFLFTANEGMPLLPLARTASGGELARAMLALRLVLSGVGDDTAPPTLVFDEVDAGVGGEAAVAVGQALATLSAQRQVLVVTHLPQVAAFADAHVVVSKDDVAATAATVDGEDRVIELSRMLSGSPASATARQHAEELLAGARGRAR